MHYFKNVYFSKKNYQKPITSNTIIEMLLKQSDNIFLQLNHSHIRQDQWMSLTV